MTAAHEGVLRERHSLEVQLGLSVKMSVGSDLQTVSIYPPGIGPLDFQGVDKALGVPGHACCSDQFQTLSPDASKPWDTPAKKRTKRETQRKKERNNTKTTLLSMSKSIVKGKVKEPKASKECLN